MVVPDGWRLFVPWNFICNPAGCEELVSRGWHLPRKPYSESGRVRRACCLGMTPASEALFRIRQGAKSLFPGDGTCLGSLIPNPAGCEELAGQGRHLPRKPYSKSGSRVRRTCCLGMTPAPEALFQIRQGAKSFVARGWHLPKKLYLQSGRGEIAIHSKATSHT